MTHWESDFRKKSYGNITLVTFSCYRNFVCIVVGSNRAKHSFERWVSHSAGLWSSLSDLGEEKERPSEEEVRQRGCGPLSSLEVYGGGGVLWLLVIVPGL